MTTSTMLSQKVMRLPILPAEQYIWYHHTYSTYVRGYEDDRAAVNWATSFRVRKTYPRTPYGVQYTLNPFQGNSDIGRLQKSEKAETQLATFARQTKPLENRAANLLTMFFGSI